MVVLTSTLGVNIVVFWGFLFSCIFWLNTLASVSMESNFLSPIYSYGDDGDRCFNSSVNYRATHVVFRAVDMNYILFLSGKNSIVSDILSALAVVTYVI